MAERARAEVDANWDMATITRELEMSYREIVRAKASRGKGSVVGYGCFGDRFFLSLSTMRTAARSSSIGVNSWAAQT